MDGEFLCGGAGGGGGGSQGQVQTAGPSRSFSLSSAPRSRPQELSWVLSPSHEAAEGAYCPDTLPVLALNPVRTAVSALDWVEQEGDSILGSVHLAKGVF